MAKLIVQCKYCEKDIPTFPSRVKRRKDKFCSVGCSAKHRTEKAKENKNVLNQTCAWCDKQFYRRPSKTKSKSGLYFCSRECKDLASRMSGGIKEIMPKHYGTGVTSYRDRALEHYGAECQRCEYDKLVDILEVHHKDRDHKNIDICNFEVLCKNCHFEEHLEEKKERWEKLEYTGAVNYKIKWPELEKLKQMVIDSSYVAVGKKLGVSDVAVKKHIWKRDISFKTERHIKK